MVTSIRQSLDEGETHIWVALTEGGILPKEIPRDAPLNLGVAASRQNAAIVETPSAAPCRDAATGKGFMESEPALADLAQQLLADDELERARRFRHARDQRQYVLAHALVRLVLSQYVPIAPQDWRFRRDASDKPFIAAPHSLPLIQFSLSHTHGALACLVTLAEKAGVDVERIEPLADLPLLAKEVLSPAEFQSLNCLPECERRARFFEHWTLKEAYAKARGEGLSLALREVSFEIGSSAPPRVWFDPKLDDHPEDWQFWLQRASPRHALAAAVQSRSPKGGPIILKMVEMTASPPPSRILISHEV